MMVTANMTMEEFIAAGGDPDDPFTPSRFLRGGGAGAVHPGLTADSTDEELRAAAERYAAGGYEKPNAVLARLQDARWELQDHADPNPGLPTPKLIVTPWSEDVDLMEMLDDLEAAYPGANGSALAGVLRDLRWHLREAVAARTAAAVQPVADSLADMVHADTDDDAIALMVACAEAGSGGPIPGLVRELRVRREMKRIKTEEFGEADRVSVAESRGAPRITNFGEGAVGFVQPGACGCRCEPA